MGITRRGNVYQIKFKFKGRTVRRSAGVGASYEQAREQEVELKRQLQQQFHDGRIGKSRQRYFEEVLIEWLEGVGDSPRDPATKNHIKHARPFIEGRPLEDAVECANELIKAGRVGGNRKSNKGKPLAPATINQRLQVIRHCLMLAHQWKWISWAPHGMVPMLSVENKREIYLEPEQVTALMAHCKAGHPDAPRAIMLASLTGLRRGELLGLTPDQFRDGAIVLTSRTKGGKPRRVPVDPRYHFLLDPLPLQITPKQLRASWVAARAAVGLPHVWFHDLRHAFASWLLASGASLADIQKLLGHADIHTTMRYIALAKDRLQTVVEGLPRLEKPRGVTKVVTPASGKAPARGKKKPRKH